MKIKLLDVLYDYYYRKRAILAFNVQNLYQIHALKLVTDELRIPAIVQFSTRYIDIFEKRFGFRFLNEKYKNDFMYFHLDHCIDVQLIKHCIDIGFDGVMFDGSSMPLSQNISLSKKIMTYANNKVVVECELGEVKGVEDGFGSEKMTYAKLDEISEFVKKTNVHLLALGIGNAHGYYKSLEGIDISLLFKARNLLNNNQLLVLHGGSGLPDNLILESIQAGVVKINISTQLKSSTNEGLRNYLDRKELFNEINFEKDVLNALIPVIKSYIEKYSKIDG